VDGEGRIFRVDVQRDVGCFGCPHHIGYASLPHPGKRNEFAPFTDIHTLRKVGKVIYGGTVDVPQPPRDTCGNNEYEYEAVTPFPFCLTAYFHPLIPPVN
jgi:hypothetical protein